MERCKVAAGYYANALQLFPVPESGLVPKVLTYSGFYGYGIKELWDSIYDYIDHVKENGYFKRRRQQQNMYWMYETIDERLRNGFYQDEDIKTMLHQAEYNIEEGKQTSFVAAQSLLDFYFKKIKNE